MPGLRKGILADPDAEGSRERGDLSVVQESANGAVDQQCDGQDQSEELTVIRLRATHTLYLSRSHRLGSHRANTGSSTRLTRRPRSSRSHESGRAVLHCTHRATTASSWGLCEQEGHLTTPSSSYRHPSPLVPPPNPPQFPPNPPCPVPQYSPF
jgi:hypothetical protein